MKRQRGRKSCVFDGCEKLNHSRGYCSSHDMQLRRGQTLAPLRKPRPDAAAGYEWCSKCKQFQPEEQFSPDVVRGGKARVCRGCKAEYMRGYNVRHAARVRLRTTLRTWGLTEQQYDDLFEAQSHRCAICGAERRSARTLCIDHDHATGRIRGLVCNDCNLGMGQFADRADLLDAAARYLRQGGVVHDDALKVPADSPEMRRARERDAKRARDS